MATQLTRLSPRQLNSVFISSLGEAVQRVINPNKKPLEIDVQLRAYSANLRVYLYNCTNPPGGRAPDEYKSQLIVPGQKKGDRGNFHYDGERIVLLGGYAKLGVATEEHVFVFWDPAFHYDFAFSANVQVKSSLLISALVDGVAVGKKSNGETIVACTPVRLKEGIGTRLSTVSDF